MHVAHLVLPLATMKSDGVLQFNSKGHEEEKTLLV
jgi:hypothetical protein